jgi:hypothetical protein
MWKVRNAYKLLVGIARTKRSFGNPTHKWKENIKMDVWECHFEGKD